MENFKKSVLDILAQELDCYVSDLRQVNTKYNKIKICAAIKNIPALEFPASEWNVTINYMLEEDADYQNSEEAKDHLLKSLE